MSARLHIALFILATRMQRTKRAKSLGVTPGSNTMIHGQMNGFGALGWLNQQRGWTDGCIAVTNAEMDRIMAAVQIGTMIEIVE